MRRALFLACLPLLAQEKLTLQQALEQASAQNPQVLESRLRTLEARAQAAQVESRRQPQVSAAVTGTYATTNFQGIGLLFPGILSRVGPYRTFNARPQATLSVLDLSLLSEVRQARERTKQFELQQAVVREETLLAVLQLYLRALQAESRVAAADARVKTAETVLAQTQDLEQAGAASKLDIARAERQMGIEKTTRIGAQQNRDVVVSSLIELIGSDSASIALQLEMPASRQLLPDPAAAQNRPELRVAEAQAKVSSQERLAAARERFPKLQAFGDYGLLGQGPERSLSTYQVGATVSIPLWTGRRIEQRVKEAEARVALAEQKLRKAKLQIAQQIRQSQIELDAARNAITETAKASAAARTTLELARLRFAAGLASNIDAIVAQEALAEAEELEIQARYDQQLAMARLAHAQGDVMSFLAR